MFRSLILNLSIVIGCTFVGLPKAEALWWFSSGPSLSELACDAVDAEVYAVCWLFNSGEDINLCFDHYDCPDNDEKN